MWILQDQSKGEGHRSDKFVWFNAKEILPIKYVFPLKAIYPVHHACLFEDETLNHQNQEVFVDFQVGFRLAPSDGVNSWTRWRMMTYLRWSDPLAATRKYSTYYKLSRWCLQRYRHVCLSSSCLHRITGINNTTYRYYNDTITKGKQQQSFDSAYLLKYNANISKFVRKQVVLVL